MRQRLVPALLRQRDYRLLWTAHTGSVVGDGLHSVAITWLTYSTLGAGAPGLAALGIALVIPNLALGILSGTLVDRWDRRRVMVYADLARAAITGLLALSVFAGVVSLPVVIAAGIGMILASQFFGPAQGAVLPAYVASDQIVQANAMLSTSRQAASLLTPGSARCSSPRSDRQDSFSSMVRRSSCRPSSSLVSRPVPRCPGPRRGARCCKRRATACVSSRTIRRAGS